MTVEDNNPKQSLWMEARDPRGGSVSAGLPEQGGVGSAVSPASAGRGWLRWEQGAVWAGARTESSWNLCGIYCLET